MSVATCNLNLAMCTLTSYQLLFVTNGKLCQFVLVCDTLYQDTANWQNNTLAQLKLKQT